MKFKTGLMICVGCLFLSTVTAVALLAIRGRSMNGGPPSWGVVPAFTLTEAGGHALGRADLEGRVWIASFVFTRCATVCPRMMKQVVRLQPQLPLREDLRLVTFSVDPDFDTPEVLRDYAAWFGVDRRNWLFLTGPRETIWTLAREGFHLAAGEVADADMPILHSSKLVLVDRLGRIRGYYDSDDEPALQQLLRDTKRLVAERS